MEQSGGARVRRTGWNSPLSWPRRADPLPVRDLDPEATDLEGYLFPDTYELPRGLPEPARCWSRACSSAFAT